MAARIPLALVVHIDEAAEAPPSSQARAKTVSRTWPRVHRMDAERVAARAQAALDFARAIEIAGSSQAAVARALKVDPSVVSDWCEPTSGKQPTIGDLRRMPPTVFEAYRAIETHGGEAVTAKLTNVRASLVAALALIDDMRRGR